MATKLLFWFSFLNLPKNMCIDIQGITPLYSTILMRAKVPV